MFKSVRAVMVLGVLGVAAVACTVGNTSGGPGGSSGSSGSSGSTVPQQQAQVTSPTSGLTITATISAATLGEGDCGGSGLRAAPAGDCAESADGGGCGGPSYCQQSNVQIAFTSEAGAQGAKVEIVSVTLHDSATGGLVDTLAASKPQSWTGSGYAAWDETLEPGAELKASYDLSAPKWSTVTSAKGTSSYSTKYKLNVTLRIDGVEVVLQSTDLNREPQVAT